MPQVPLDDLNPSILKTCDKFDESSSVCASCCFYKPHASCKQWELSFGLALCATVERLHKQNVVIDARFITMWKHRHVEAGQTSKTSVVVSSSSATGTNSSVTVSVVSINGGK